MEVLTRPVGYRKGYSLEGVAPFLGYGGDGVSSYKRKWDADGLKHIQKYGKKFKREQGQRQRYDTPSHKDLPRKKRNPFSTSRRRSRRSRMQVPRTVPRAPFNDSSFLMKVRRAGGLEALVSPSPATSSRVAYHREDEVFVLPMKRTYSSGGARMLEQSGCGVQQVHRCGSRVAVECTQHTNFK